MDIINLTNEQKLIQNEIRKFATTELEPISSDIDKGGTPPAAVLKKLSNLGFLCPVVPENYGGVGLDTTSLVIIIEELSKASAALGLVLAINNFVVANAIIKNENEGLKQNLLKRLTMGEIGGYDLGSRIQGQLTVEDKDGVKLISGTSRFILNGKLSGFLLINIKHSGESGIYIVPELGKNIRVENLYTLGMKSAGIANCIFDKLPLKEEFLIVKQATQEILNQIEDYFNLGISAIGLGLAEAALESAIKYARERKQFGKPICEFSMIQEMIADMKVKIEGSRNLVYDAASRCDANEPYALATKIAMLSSTEAAVFSGIKSVQIYGGSGYIKDYPAERFLRDAKTLQTISGTPGFIKEQIAQSLIH